MTIFTLKRLLQLNSRTQAIVVRLLSISVANSWPTWACLCFLNSDTILKRTHVRVSRGQQVAFELLVLSYQQVWRINFHKQA